MDLDGDGKDTMIIRNMLRDEIVPFEATHGVLAMSKSQPVGTLLGYYDYNYRSWYQSGPDPSNPAITWNAMNHYGFLSRISRFWRGSHTLLPALDNPDNLGILGTELVLGTEQDQGILGTE